MYGAPTIFVLTGLALDPRKVDRLPEGARPGNREPECVPVRDPWACVSQLAACCLALVLLLISFAASADSTDDFFWDVIGGCKTVEGTKSYLRRYPEGLHAEEALRCLQRWQREQDAWDRAKNCQDREAVERYMEDFAKGGRYTKEAQECLDRWSNVPFQIDRKNAVCEEHFKANRLLTGVGGTAVECWLEVLALDESNMVAIDGLKRVSGKYLGWARSALGRGEVAKARQHVEKLKRLNSEAPEIAELEEAIGLFEKYLDDAQAALEEGNLGTAEEYAGKLGELYPDAPQVKELEEAIAKAKSPPVPDPEPVPVPDPGPVPAPDPPRAAGEEFRDCDNCPLMVVVPGGAYQMGSSFPWVVIARPKHIVTIAQPFAVGVYEVTFDEWDACRDDGGCSHSPDDRGWGRGKHPVINVSWEDAQQYVGWLSRKTGKTYRLPSESEWEYVARAGTDTAYSWGASVYIRSNKRANCKGCGGRWDGQKSAPVGSFPKNDFGLHDVHGNVWERVEDCVNASYSGAPADGRAWTEGRCSERMMRGGSWKHPPSDMRASHRGFGAAGKRSDTAGFRVARTLAP